MIAIWPLLKWMPSEDELANANLEPGRYPTDEGVTKSTGRTQSGVSPRVTSAAPPSSIHVSVLRLMMSSALQPPSRIS